VKNYTNSDYALNKYSAGIVYRFADGIVEYTLADYLRDNPGKTEADFRELKKLSDSIYLEQVQTENAQTKKNTPFDELDETMLCYAPSPEDVFIGEISAREEAERRQRRVELKNRALDALTDVQRRRYLLYKVDGLSSWKIAEIESVDHKAILRSIWAAEKKIKKVLGNA